MWGAGESSAPRLSVLLIFVIVANCEIIFSGGNTAGLVVGLTVIAAWCFLRQRFVVAGVICLAVSLVVKPHDAGLIWLYFLVAGRPHAKRALQSAALALGMALIAFFWVSHCRAYTGLPELRSANLATISAPGGINEPGPRSIGVNSPDMIIDLQTVISIFCDDPRVYQSCDLCHLRASSLRVVISCGAFTSAVFICMGRNAWILPWLRSRPCPYLSPITAPTTSSF